MDERTEKRCPRCGLLKQIEQFDRKRRAPHRYKRSCRACLASADHSVVLEGRVCSGCHERLPMDAYGFKKKYPTQRRRTCDTCIAAGVGPSEVEPEPVDPDMVGAKRCRVCWCFKRVSEFDKTASGDWERCCRECSESLSAL